MANAPHPLGLTEEESGEPAFSDVGLLQEQLSELAPGFSHSVQDSILGVVVYGALATTNPASQAVALIINQAVNDAQDLTIELADLHGRPATRTARALVEHAVNLHTVLSSPEAASRYERHSAVASQVEGRAKFGLDRLRAKEYKSEQHRLRKLLRDTAEAFQAAISDYGSRYSRGWASADLFTRATNAGLTDLYEYYRFSSMVLHGAAGGTAGTVSRSYEGRSAVHRTGPSLELCISAYHEGLRALRSIFEQLDAADDVLDMAPALEEIDGVLSHWPEYRRAVKTLDKHLWPSEAPPRPSAVFCIFRSGATRWYMHDPRFGVMVEAAAPAPGAMTEVMEERLKQITKKVARDFPPDDICVTVHVGGLRVAPLPGKQGIPDTAFLIPRSRGRIFEEPIRIERGSDIGEALR